MDDFLKGTTLTFRILYRMNIMRDYQKHGRITFFKLIYFILATFVKRILFTYAYMEYIFEPLNKSSYALLSGDGSGVRSGKMYISDISFPWISGTRI